MRHKLLLDKCHLGCRLQDVLQAGHLLGCGDQLSGSREPAFSAVQGCQFIGFVGHSHTAEAQRSDMLNYTKDSASVFVRSLYGLSLHNMEQVGK